LKARFHRSVSEDLRGGTGSAVTSSPDRLAAQVNVMPQSIRQPEDILAYRPLKHILSAK